MVFTLAGDGNVQLGGDGKFAGILCHPWGLARPGLDATLAVAANDALELADMGRLIVRSAVAANPGEKVFYDTATGAIAGTAEDDGLALEFHASFPYDETAWRRFPERRLPCSVRRPGGWP